MFSPTDTSVTTIVRASDVRATGPAAAKAPPATAFGRYVLEAIAASRRSPALPPDAGPPEAVPALTSGAGRRRSTR